MTNHDVESLSMLEGMVNGEWLDRQEFPPLEWTVEGVVPEGFGLLVAPPKAGKSWMVAGIGLACAAGGYALGKIPVKRRPVLYLALEDGHRRLQSRFRTIMEDAPIPRGIDVITQATSSEIPGIIAEYLILHAERAPLVILDTLGKVKPPKRAGDDSYAADYAIGSRLKALIDSAPGAALVVVHHTRKAESSDFIDAVSGTQGIAGSADFVLVLGRKRQSDDAVLSVTGRDVPEAEYALTTTGGRWALDGMDLMDAAAAASRRRASDGLADPSVKAVEFVASRSTGTRPAELAEHLGVDPNRASTVLQRLHSAGRIGKQSRGVYIPLSDVSEVTDYAESESLTSITSLTYPPDED
ncbi:AAA family ATPase [Aldersonia kunmingensis]|uniref:AAA family ATPase n=1 Tax=Aldersonia kunmingensis TaxID=408066 RepID=UPI000837667C|nr:AAA family ATPase [Aldersonia kunmingensis]